VCVERAVPGNEFDNGVVPRAQISVGVHEAA
jgi:hypothetical protein